VPLLFSLIFPTCGGRKSITDFFCQFCNFLFAFFGSTCPTRGGHQPSRSSMLFPVSGIWTCLISIKSDLEIHFFWNPVVSHFHPNRFGNSFFWDPICPTSIHTDSEIHFFWNLDMSHFHPNRFANSLFLESNNVPFSLKSDLQIHLFWDPNMPHFPHNRFANPLILGSGHDHFLQIRFGNSLFLESRHVPFPPKQIWKFTFDGIRTCPISVKTLCCFQVINLRQSRVECRFSLAICFLDIIIFACFLTGGCHSSNTVFQFAKVFYLRIFLQIFKFVDMRRQQARNKFCDGSVFKLGRL